MFGSRFRRAAPAAPMSSAPAAPAPATPTPTRTAPAAQPNNMSTAVGQLKSGDKFGAQNTMRQAVGLSAIAPPSADTPATMSNAIGRMKMGDRASAEAMMRKMVGLKKGGKVSSASKRADGIATKGKTKGRMV